MNKILVCVRNISLLIILSFIQMLLVAGILMTFALALSKDSDAIGGFILGIGLYIFIGYWELKLLKQIFPNTKKILYYGVFTLLLVVPWMVISWGWIIHR